MSKKYGQPHREAKQRKLASMDTVQCEMTGVKKPLEAHHTVPRLFNGPDHESNYQLLSSHFHHQVLHYTCNVSDNKMVGERIKQTNTLRKHILDDARSAEAKSKIDEIDESLIVEYIDNMMNKMSHHYREQIVRLTLINSFKTIRDLTIDNMRLKAQMAAIEI